MNLTAFAKEKEKEEEISLGNYIFAHTEMSLKYFYFIISFIMNTTIIKKYKKRVRKSSNKCTSQNRISSLTIELIRKSGTIKIQFMNKWDEELCS